MDLKVTVNDEHGNAIKNVTVTITGVGTGLADFFDKHLYDSTDIDGEVNFDIDTGNLLQNVRSIYIKLEYGLTDFSEEYGPYSIDEDEDEEYTFTIPLENDEEDD